MDTIAGNIVDRSARLEWFLRNRRRSKALFDLVAPDAYLTRPIPLRHPIVFYEGHLPAFNVNTLLKAGLGHPGLNAPFEVLFARGIDPEDESAATRSAINQWPSREAVQKYAEDADRAVLDALRAAEIERDDNPKLRRGLALFTILEHEAMHQETLQYILHRLPFDQKRRPQGVDPVVRGDPPSPATVHIPAGRATLGADPDRVQFGWDNEFVQHVVEVPEFEIDVYDVTNRDCLEFVEAGGYANPALWSAEDWRWRDEHDVRHPLFWERHDGRWWWRGMFELIPLPMAWPVYVAQAEAAAYARWKGKRLPTEAEFHRAAYGTPAGDERAFPWGKEPPGPRHGNFDFQSWDPVPVGSHPAGASAWGVHDLVGNGWEWTCTVFGGFAGFRPLVAYPAYSADFFDGQHYVIKGGSPATARELLRRSFRNWFRPHYPFVYATFRCVAA